MQGTDVGQVVEVNGATAANEKLAQGWNLLTASPGAPRGSSELPSLIYVLGKPADPPQGQYEDGDWVPGQSRWECETDCA